MTNILQVFLQGLILMTMSGVFLKALARNEDCPKNFSENYLSSNQKLNDLGFKYNFNKIAQDMISEIEVSPGSSDAKCLSDLYENEMAKTGQAVGEAYLKSSCQASCKANIEIQKKQLDQLDLEYRKDLKAVSSSKSPAPEKCDSGSGPLEALKEAKNSLCCGNKSENGTGSVRGIYPDITYQGCLAKTNPTNKDAASIASGGQCLANVLKEGITAVWNNLTSILTIPAELWAAKAQIWQLITNSDARAEFAKKMMSLIGKFVTDRVESVNSCLNPYEKTQFICKLSGQILGELVTPGSILKLFKMLKNVNKAGGLIEGALSESVKGKAILVNIEKAKAKSAESVKRIGDSDKAAKKASSGDGAEVQSQLKKMSAKENAFDREFKNIITKHTDPKSKAKPETSKTGSVSGESPSRVSNFKSERSQKSFAKIMSNQKNQGKTLPQVVRENASLSDAQRIGAIKSDFPNLSDKQVKSIVKVVHRVGSERAGASIYKYTDREIAAKMKQLKELGVGSEDRRALLSLGYAGEVGDEGSALFKSLLEKDYKPDSMNQPTSTAGTGSQAKSTSVNKTLSEKLADAKSEFEGSSRDPKKRAALRKEISLMEKDLNNNEISEFQKKDTEKFGDLIGRLDREKPTKIGDSTFVQKTISVPQTEIAITDKDLLHINKKEMQRATAGGSDFSNLLKKESSSLSIAENAKVEANKIAKLSIDAAKKMPEIHQKELQLQQMKNQLGPRSAFDPKVMKLQSEIDILKYAASPLSEYELSRFSALDEIPKNVMELSTQEKNLISDLKKIESQKKWVSGSDLERFKYIKKIEARPLENRKAAISKLARDAEELNVGKTSYSHSHYTVQEGVRKFSNEMGANFRKYDAPLERLFRSSPRDISHASSELTQDYKVAESFYRDYAKKSDNGPGVKFMLERVKIYFESFENGRWISSHQ